MNYCKVYYFKDYSTEVIAYVPIYVSKDTVVANTYTQANTKSTRFGKLEILDEFYIPTFGDKATLIPKNSKEVTSI